jgi:hypothetical protein
LFLATAQATGCAHWLIDRRTHPRQHPAALHEWMHHDFLPRVRTALGRPLHVAFLAAPAECARLHQLQHDRPQDWHFPALRLGWFATEADALAWLHPAAPGS